MKVGSITLPWADGEYPFRLANGDWQELQRKLIKHLVKLGVSEQLALASSTPMAIYKRIGGGDPFAGEVGELIFQALVGGGMEAQEAAALRNRYAAPEKPQLVNLPTAHAIVLHGLMGPPEVEEKKAEAEEAKPSSPSADSTVTALRSDTRRKKSTT